MARIIPQPAYRGFTNARSGKLMEVMRTHVRAASVPQLDLNDCRLLPQLGFGVFQVPPEDTAAAVQRALEVGYRLIDTATTYGNEAGVGDGIAASGLDRDDVFVTTKLWNDDQGRERALRAFDESLERLDSEYVDLYLIHWPVPSQDRYVETWEALCELKDAGIARSIGASNFLVEHLERIIDATGTVPAVNQIELHLELQQAELRDFDREHGIVTEAWSPLGQGSSLEHPTVREIAEAHGRTPAQVVLRWHIQLGNMVIPKLVTPARIEENFTIFDFQLSDEEMAALEALDSGKRTGPDPARFG
jgi:2,5-diketo-D-gluconate reductase A